LYIPTAAAPPIIAFVPNEDVAALYKLLPTPGAFDATALAPLVKGEALLAYCPAPCATALAREDAEFPTLLKKPPTRAVS
jgi:hypothetical protein